MRLSRATSAWVPQGAHRRRRRHRPAPSCRSPGMDQLPERSELLEERLAKAAALPPDQRSPEVAAFIECAALQAETAQLLAQRPPRSVAARRQHWLLISLKIVRSHCLSPGQGPLGYRPSALKVACDRLFELCEMPSDSISNSRAAAITALLQRDSNLDTLLRVAAGLGVARLEGDEAGMMQAASGVVRRLQQPAEEARLRRELAAVQAQLPVPLLTFEQLLMFFAEYAWRQCEELLTLLASGAAPPALQQAIK